MRPTDFCLPLYFLKPVPALWAPGLLGHAPVRERGATGGSVASRRAGPALAGRAATRPGIRRRVPFAGVSAPRKSDVVSLRTRLRLWHPVTLRVTLPPLQDSLRDARRIETASPAPREESGLPRSEMPSFASRAGFARTSSPTVSCDDDEVVCHELAARSAFRHSNGSDVRNEFCNLMRRAGTTNWASNPLPRRCCRPVRASTVGIPTARRATPICAAVRGVPCGTPHPFTRSLAFRGRAGSRFRYEPAPHLPRCVRRGECPECAAFVDGAHHFLTERRLTTTPRPIMASDVGRGLRAAADLRREGPVRAHSSREWSAAGAPPRGRPRTPSVIGPGAWRAGVRFTRRRLPPGRSRSPSVPPPAKRTSRARTRVLGSAP